MRQKHIVNIGMPRCGTTWLWHHSNFQPKQDKENSILTTVLDFERYTSYYKQFDVSANFNPNLWMVDREIINFLQKNSTHISFIVRNPFDFVERYYDWIHQVGHDPKTTTDYIVNNGYLRYTDIVARWTQSLPEGVRFKVFLFEDLTRDSEKFFYNYMDFCDIPVAQNANINYNIQINQNKKVAQTKIKFLQHDIELINQEIDQFQQSIGRDLTHWKK